MQKSSYFLKHLSICYEFSKMQMKNEIKIENRKWIKWIIWKLIWICEVGASPKRRVSLSGNAGQSERIMEARMQPIKSEP